MQPHPYQNLHWYPLTSSKNIWPKISVAYFTKWFQSIFTVGGWRMYPFNISLSAPAYILTQSCKRDSFWTLNPARAPNHKSEPGSSPTFILKPDLGPKPNLQRDLRYAQLRSDKKRCAGVVAGTRFITPKIATTLTKTLV